MIDEIRTGKASCRQRAVLSQFRSGPCPLITTSALGMLPPHLKGRKHDRTRSRVQTVGYSLHRRGIQTYTPKRCPGPMPIDIPGRNRCRKTLQNVRDTVKIIRDAGYGRVFGKISRCDDLATRHRGGSASDRGTVSAANRPATPRQAVRDRATPPRAPGCR